MESFDFSAAPTSATLLGAVEVLKEMNAAKKRKLPETAPTVFVRSRWEPHVFAGDGSIDRGGFEASHLLGYRFAPRIRNIKKTKLFPMRRSARYPNRPALRL